MRYKMADVVTEIKEKEDHPSESKYERFVGLEHYVSGEIVIRNFGSTELLESSMKVFRSGDILVARRNVYLKRASVAMFDGLTSGDSIVLRAKNERVGRLLPFVLNTDAFWDFADQYSDGTMSKRLSPKTLMEYEFDLPDESEQDELADILWAAVDAKHSYQELLKQTDELVKSRFIELFGDVQKEEKYKGIPLKKICRTTSGGTPSTKFPEFYRGNIPWITTVSLGPNHIDGTNAKGYITKQAIESSATKLIPAGNILFGTRVGVGKSSINDVDICTNQDIVAIVGIDESKFKKLFIKHVLDSYQKHYDSLKKGATILGITSDDLKETLIPLAPMDVQKEFENFVEQVDKSKLAVQQGLEKLETLKKSLMQQYFG